MLLVRYVGYAWAFATIWPAILITAELVGAIRDRRAPAYRRLDPEHVPLDALAWASIIAGAIMLLLPIVYPSPWLAAPVWLGFIFLLDPINAKHGAESLRGDLRAKHPGRLINLHAGRLRLRAALGMLELLGPHQVGLHRAGAARHQALRDAARGLPRLPRLRGRVLRDVRLRAPPGLAWLLASDRTIISRLMGTATTLEREVKLSFDSAEAAREAVDRRRRHAPARPPAAGRRPARHAGNALRDRGCALRIRMENGKSRITFKGPIQDSAMKLRDEFETVVGDGVLLLRIFEELGYQVWFRYEKYREEFAHEDVIVAIDETPVGVFVEIEGSESGITAMAAAMGRGPDDYILDSYRGLFLKHRAALGLTGADMVFDAAE